MPVLYLDSTNDVGTYAFVRIKFHVFITDRLKKNGIIFYQETVEFAVVRTMSLAFHFTGVFP